MLGAVSQPSGPLLAPSPLRRALLRAALFAALMELTLGALIVALGSSGKDRFVLLFGLGLALPAGLVALLELKLGGRARPWALLAGLGGYAAGLLGVLFALAEARYLDTLLGSRDVQHALLEATDTLRELVSRSLPLVLTLALPFGASTASRVLLRRAWAQPALSLAVCLPLTLLLTRWVPGADGQVVLVLSVVGAVALPVFGALADRVERRVWPEAPLGDLFGDV